MERLRKNWAKVFLKMCEKNKLTNTVLRIEYGKGDFLFKQSWFNTDENKTFALASVSKLFTAACGFQLLDQGKLKLEDKVGHFFNASEMSSLHRVKMSEMSGAITIGHL